LIIISGLVLWGPPAGAGKSLLLDGGNWFTSGSNGLQGSLFLKLEISWRQEITQRKNKAKEQNGVVRTMIGSSFSTPPPILKEPLL
jgi:hypothetical protein